MSPNRGKAMPLGPDGDLLRSDWLWSRLPRVDRINGPCASRYPGIVRELVARLKLNERSEWHDYGSGTASYVDVWVYRNDPAFRRPRYDNVDHAFTGLWILLCRLAPCYVMGEGTQSWAPTHGGRYMPAFADIDRLETPRVAQLAAQAEQRLGAHDLTRLSRHDLAPLLPPHGQFQTDLSDAPLRIFDALFFWND